MKDDQIMERNPLDSSVGINTYTALSLNVMPAIGSCRGQQPCKVCGVGVEHATLQLLALCLCLNKKATNLERA